ncbi:MAG TPA: SigE family RNA polymerase sigma factor [Mycobacteriales bacterium]|nr:SigE family RNA polymerase sigma factor [Mycobacteriales bacterium]
MVGAREQAFLQLADTRLPALLRLGYLLTGSPDQAQDLVQEALARTYGRLVRIRDDNALEAYVRRCMSSIVVDQARRNGRLRAADVDGEADSRELDRVEDRDSLQRLLRMLSPLQRACIVLRFYEDLSIAEVADRLGCSPGTVKRETHDALARVRLARPTPDTEEQA